MANPAPISLDQLFRFYRNLPHQRAAIAELEEDIRANGYAAAMRRNRPWFSAWSQDGKQSDDDAVAPSLRVRPTNPLTGFPYFSQLDNPGGQGQRECQTSAIAMCLAYLGAGGIESDGEYRAIVRKFGDTTSQAAHQQALASLGVRARFVMNCSAPQAQAEIRSGLPLCMGILHRGPVSAPTGGGHWVSCYGFDAHAWVISDPYGELDVVNGGYLRIGGSSGLAQRYSYRNLNPRWLVEGPASGWAWLFS